MQTEITVRDGCMVMKLTGQPTPREWVAGLGAMFEAHAKEAALRGCSTMLYDLRELGMILGITELYETGVALAASPCAGIRMACLARQDQVTPDRFFQKVAINRGVPVKVCLTEAEAAEWLAGAPAS